MKATSRAILYLLVITFFIVYQLFISGNISLVFAGPSCCADSDSDCIGNDCSYCDLSGSCSAVPTDKKCDAPDGNNVCTFCTVNPGPGGMCCGGHADCNDEEASACFGTSYYCTFECDREDYEESQNGCNCGGGDLSIDTCGNGESWCWMSAQAAGHNCCESGETECGDDVANLYGACNSGTYRTAADTYSVVCYCGNEASTSGDDCNADADTKCWDTSEAECCGDDGASDDWCDSATRGGGDTTGYCLNAGYALKNNDADEDACECDLNDALTNDQCDSDNEQCWDVSQAECCGDDGASDDWCDGTAGGCINGWYRTDGDADVYICETCMSKNWNTTAVDYDAGTPSCCGDDASENWNSKTCASGICTSDAGDNGCCDLSTDCVNNTICYADGDFFDLDSDGWNEKCSSGTWVDGINPRFSLNNSNTTTPAVGGAVLLYSNWTDDKNLNFSWLWTNETGGNGRNYTTSDPAGYRPIDINLTAGETWSNFTWKNTSITSGTVIAWKIYANDSSNNENVTGEGTFTVLNIYLEVDLSYPPDMSVGHNTTFNVNATVYCRVDSCGNVFGTLRYNDTDMNITKGEKPFYNTSGSNPQSCGSLSLNQFCQLNWTLNATGDFIKKWNIGVLFNSSTAGINDNYTDNSTITILECVDSGISLGWSSIDFGILNPNTNNYSAPGNTAKTYNVTNLGECTLMLWIKGTDIENSSLSYPNKIGVGNFSWSNTTNDVTTAYKMTESYFIVNSSFTPSIINITTYYWLTVPQVYAGRYNGTKTLCSNTTQQSGGSNVCT